ncbi:erythrose-4-phosphate dehydrogenase [Oleiphilus sp. HI0071]|uniref:type I glyceraldehyde-3-phosphate dehydrogenase n=1 Tax=Oleiphilus sp. HI0080 TaxID=1822255 RepID=UPI0007C3C0C9|nr:type I glyceraldehyde-3-phosphate dehydrogenase [Oleiphilus sp. HI0080]KZY63560.1 erythrose-4-phosphate dehydrogenase [Oleiphilus sp. HI0065]KZY88603.1 erythrose-4-phosphate dehydrogenase [Oleiphilus sp. HI0071]KZY97876.1 erythrose-4-phosphate dehydrogenase [Oleiphilus sp. HI0073]KZZ50040.1 erythrose-4-phosphate dehydrogenase [Oleiphilus sp. HI0122]KZY63937.1 erythrose-4-phosphate dehydrogenase [Oleiphilus sp. HI0065]
MKWRIAINGYGRIGQSVLRALYSSNVRKSCEIVAINELADIDTVAYLTRYDSTHGRFRLPVSVKDKNTLEVDGDEINLSHFEDLDSLRWKELSVDIVLECTGVYATRADAQKHINAGAKFVLFSQPASSDVDKTVVFGVNEDTITRNDFIVSNASCTTNAIVPVLHSLHESFGIASGSLMTIHSAMNDQPIIDAYHHKDLRRTRSAMSNMVPVETALAKGIERLLPELEGRLNAVAMRVPTINVSAIDLNVVVERDVSAAEVNALLAERARTSYCGVMAYTEEPLASSDFIQDAHSCTIDGSQTRVSQGSLVKVLVWFDNEWGFANRMLDVADHWCREYLN